MTIIDLQQLSKCYGSKRAVDSLTLRVEAGSVFGFLGPNGAGKTTTIRMMMGFLKPTAGRASIFGLDCSRDSHRIKADVGYLPGDLRLYGWMNGHSALKIFGAVRSRDLSETGAELALLFDLDMTVPVKRMSRGMRQKLGLILACAHEPRLLILDEPSSGLDPIMQIRLKEYLQARARTGCTVFFSSHTLSEVEDVCDRVAILRGGQLMEELSLERLREQAKPEVSIVWSHDAKPDAEEPPPFYRLIERNGRTWRGVLAGPMMTFIRWAADQPLDDLTIGAPDLEAYFRRHYTDELASPPAAPSASVPEEVPG